VEGCVDVGKYLRGYLLNDAVTETGYTVTCRKPAVTAPSFVQSHSRHVSSCWWGGGGHISVR
jgi:hypothetical protein